MKQMVTILSARRWDMTDDNGTSRSGVSVFYLMTDKLSHHVDTDGTLGFIPIKQSIPLDVAKNLKEVPGHYDADFAFKSVQGQNILSIQNITFVSGIKG